MWHTCSLTINKIIEKRFICSVYCFGFVGRDCIQLRINVFHSSVLWTTVFHLFGCPQNQSEWQAVAVNWFWEQIQKLWPLYASHFPPLTQARLYLKDLNYTGLHTQTEDITVGRGGGGEGGGVITRKNPVYVLLCIFHGRLEHPCNF